MVDNDADGDEGGRYHGSEIRKRAEKRGGHQGDLVSSAAAEREGGGLSGRSTGEDQRRPDGRDAEARRGEEESIETGEQSIANRQVDEGLLRNKTVDQDARNRSRSRSSVPDDHSQNADGQEVCSAQRRQRLRQIRPVFRGRRSRDERHHENRQHRLAGLQNRHAGR